MDDITTRQRRILDFIKRTVHDRGYPPTVREIGDAVGLTSSSSVHAQLANLERRGLLRRDPTKPRAMRLRGQGGASDRGVPVPLLGRVPAGGPALADQDIEEYLVLPGDYAGQDHFALRVRGDEGSSGLRCLLGDRGSGAAETEGTLARSWKECRSPRGRSSSAQSRVRLLSISASSSRLNTTDWGEPCTSSRAAARRPTT